MNGFAAINLLCACLREPNAEQAPPLRRRLGEADLNWPQLSMLASHHLVSPALHGSLSRAGLLDAIPTDFAAALAALVELNRTRNERVLAQLAEVAVVLNRTGIAPVPLKGAATLIQGGERARNERIVGDIDLLVPSGRVEDAKSALLAAGYFCDRRIGLKLRLHYRVMHDTEPLLHPAHITHVEIHRRFLYSIRASRIISRMGSFLRCTVGSNGEVLSPDPASRFLHNMLHHQLQDKHWRQAALDLRQLHEGYLLASQAVIDWNQLAATLRDAGLGHFLAAYLESINRLFGSALPVAAEHAAGARRWFRRVERRYSSPSWDRWDRAVHGVLGFPAAAAWRVRHWLRMLAALIAAPG